jgi:hypothetical protein
MHSAVVKMLKLGKISPENYFHFGELYDELPDKLTLEEAEALVNVFADDADDDYGALAWDFIRLFQRTDEIKNSTVFRNSNAYWIKVLMANPSRLR